MSMFTPGNTVKLNPDILEDATIKANHHLFQRVLDENGTGEVLCLDTTASTSTLFKYWLMFPRFKVMLKEDHFVLLSKE